MKEIMVHCRVLIKKTLQNNMVPGKFTSGDELDQSLIDKGTLIVFRN
jgi:hypothetical protein